MTLLKYSIENDGLDHVNVYTKGKTLLGRQMSNLSDCHIDHPRYGHFRTLEGLWYFLKTGKTDEYFRILSGYDCRKRGKEKDTIWNVNFQREFKVGIICKILAYPPLENALRLSELPFVHYYYYGKDPKNMKLIVPKGHEWQMEFWESMRQHLKAGRDIRPIIDDLLNFEQLTKDH